MGYIARIDARFETESHDAQYIRTAASEKGVESSNS